MPYCRDDYPKPYFMKELTPPMIVAWFRQQARKFNEMADFVEGTFAAGIPNVRISNGASLPVSAKRTAIDPGPFTPENVRDLVTARGHRAADIAKHFGVPITRVNEMINDPGSG